MVTGMVPREQEKVTLPGLARMCGTETHMIYYALKTGRIPSPTHKLPLSTRRWYTREEAEQIVAKLKREGVFNE